MKLIPENRGGLAEFLEERDIVSLIRWNLFFFIGLAAVALAGFSLFQDEDWAFFARIGLLLVADSLLLVWLLRRGQVILAAYAALFTYGGITFYAAWNGTGVTGTTYALFLLVVVAAALFLGRQAGYLAAGLAACLGLVLLLAGRAGWLPELHRPPLDVVSWITLSVCFFIGARTVSLVLRQAERALVQAQRELAERIRAEMEVRRLNSELEARVSERTAQLEAREAFVTGIFDGAGDAILTLNEQQRILSFSKSAERIFGYAAHEVVGQALDLLLPEKSIELHRQQVQAFGEATETTRFMGHRREILGRRKDGRLFPAEASISKITVADQLIFSAFLWDISERRQLEQAVREREHRFRRVFEISPVAIVVTTLEEGRILDANDAYWKLSGHDPRSSLGKTTLELRQGYDPEKRRAFVQALLEQRSIRDQNYIFVDDSGQERPTLAFYELIDLEGQLTILSMFYDMTEQMESQNALRRSEAHVRGLLHAIPDAIFEIRRDGLVLQYSPAADPGTKLPAEDLAGRSIEELMPAPVAAQIRFAVERALESRLLHVIQYQLLAGDQETTYEARVVANGEATVLMIVRDMSLYRWLETEREAMIAELERRNAESESLRETTVIVTSTLDVNEVVQRMLQQIKRVIPYDSASVWQYRENMVHLLGGDNIPELPQSDQHFPISEQEPDYPLWTNQLPYVLLEDIQIDHPQFRNPPINYIHGWLAVPLRVRGKLIGSISLDSRQVGRFTPADAHLVLNYANQVSIALEHARLFTDLESELFKRQELINELDAKNAEMERFTYAVSHDLKSPLVTIKGFMGFLKTDLAAGDQARVESDLQRMSGAMEIMQQRLSGLLELARAGRLASTLAPIAFNDLVEEALELVHGRLSQRGIAVEVEESLPWVLGDRQRLLEAVQNLLDNAAKFMGEQTRPKIEIGACGEEHGLPVFFIRDNGQGIAPEHQERIFGIFNKLDPAAEGSGIGLSLVKKIIETHGGRIRVESQVGQGATFFFSLPRADSSA